MITRFRSESTRYENYNFKKKKKYLKDFSNRKLERTDKVLVKKKKGRNATGLVLLTFYQITLLGLKHIKSLLKVCTVIKSPPLLDFLTVVM